ncbi:hypothetical protein [Candidatus Tokpelaia sp.]|nr:hypothetical protein [Candidatus Tokpelaia sp.]
MLCFRRALPFLRFVSLIRPVAAPFMLVLQFPGGGEALFAQKR